MKVNQRNYRAFWAALPLVLFIFIWLALAPAQVGGEMVYVILNGTSMEPQFKYGDLVMLRQSSGYQIGDAVAYKNADLGRYVFHRIVREENSRFILKGDNNNWEDDYAPMTDELLGKLWLHIPKAGKAVHWLRQPLVLAATTAILLISAILGVFMTTKNKTTRNVEDIEWVKSVQSVFYTLGFLTFTSLLLCLFAFAKPLSRGSVVTIPLNHFGSFTYTGNAPQGVYDTTTFNEPSPVFPALTCQANIGFGYTLISEQLTEVSGTYKVDALIREEQSKWNRTIPLIPITGFSSNFFLTNANIDFCHIQNIIREFEENADFHSPSYILAISPEIQVSGKTKGKSFIDIFKPSVEFKYDGEMFAIRQTGNETNPFAPTATGSILYPSILPNNFQFLGAAIPVRVLRQVGLLVFIFSSAGFVILAFLIKNITVKNPELLVKVKYGSFLLDIKESNIEPSQKTITVTSIDELARIAEAQNKFIYFKKQNLSVFYYVTVEDVTFRFIQPIKIEKGNIEKKKGENNLFREVISK